MKIGIITAMQVEHDQIEALLTDCAELPAPSFGAPPVLTGRLGDHTVVLAMSGIGKVNAALTAASLIAAHRPDAMISTGCAGGLAPEPGVMGVVAAAATVYHDVWCGEGNAYGQVQGCPPRFACLAELTARFTASGEVKREGLFVSGEYFIPSHPMLRDLNARFSNPLAIDMESAAVAQTCWIEGYPFAALRAISDTPGQPILNPTEQYLHFWENDADNAFGTIMNIIKNI